MAEDPTAGTVAPASHPDLEDCSMNQDDVFDEDEDEEGDRFHGRDDDDDDGFDRDDGVMTGEDLPLLHLRQEEHQHQHRRREQRRQRTGDQVNRNTSRTKKYPRRRGSSFLVYKTFDEDNIMNPHQGRRDRAVQQERDRQRDEKEFVSEHDGKVEDSGLLQEEDQQRVQQQKHHAAIVVILLGFLTAIGLGCLVGIVPQIATKRYTELIAITTATAGATTTTADTIMSGTERAQSVASLAAFGRYSLALLTNALLGSWSDMYGRKPVQVLGLTLLTFSPLTLIAVQLIPSLSPTWYFVIASLESVVHFLSIGFIQLTDVIDEPKHRSTAYGLYFGAFMGGIAVAPFLATIMSHLAVSITSFLIRVSSLFIAICFLPETLSESNRRKEELRRRESLLTPDSDMKHAKIEEFDTKDFAPVGVERQTKTSHSPPPWVSSLYRPFREMSILGRSLPLMLISIAAFLSKAVFSADVTLFFFYGERELGVRDKDVAAMMFVTGCFGVLMQAVLLKYIISCLGEHTLLQVSFVSGCIHNLIYGLAQNKWQLYAGLCLSQLTNTNGPLLSSIASRSNGVKNTELGRIQGALFSLTSVAEALGPLSFNFAYRHWNLPYLGAGTMFGFGSCLYFLGFVAVSLTPRKTRRTSAAAAELNDFDNFESSETNKGEGQLLP